MDAGRSQIELEMWSGKCMCVFAVKKNLILCTGRAQDVDMMSNIVGYEWNMLVII